MPNSYADRIIRSMLQNKGTKSNKLLKDYPFLANEAVWDDIFAVVVETFKDETDDLNRYGKPCYTQGSLH